MAESFSTWLALREPADTAARSAALTQSLAGAVSSERPLRVLDLGTGTGSNLRYLVPYFPVKQEWLLVDRDPAVLAQVPARMSSWASSRRYAALTTNEEVVVRGEGIECHIETRCVELGDLADPAIFSARHLVTASALLDLVSATWLQALAARCRASGAAALFALNYNGRSRCLPAEPEDDAVLELFNRHQRNNDKGFGRAAGPDATDRAADSFAAAGYDVRRAASDWVLSPLDRGLQQQLIEGWAEAAAEMAPGQSPMIRNWLARRLEHVDAGRSQVVVGHEDLAAWLP